MQDEGGIWELIDGLQRLSTILEFTGLLRQESGAIAPSSTLGGTTFLPSLAGKKWEAAEGANDGIGKEQQLQIKRARLRLEILKKESDPKAKFELFQRLNSGGANLTPQEVRNSVAVMIDPAFSTWLIERANEPSFIATTNQTQAALDQQAGVELALRYFAFRSVPYVAGLDVHEYLDAALERLAGDAAYSRADEQAVFSKTFGWLDAAMGAKAFKKWNVTASDFSGKFLMSAFEVIAVGVAANHVAIDAMGNVARDAFLAQRAKDLWADSVFNANSGAGVRGTTRLANLLPMGPSFFRP